MILTTTNSIQGKEITQYIGAVTHTVYSKNYESKGLSFKESLYSVNGFKNAANLLEESKKEALNNLVEKATSAQAMAVVGVTMDVEIIQQGMYIMINVMGTAVTFK